MHGTDESVPNLNELWGIYIPFAAGLFVDEKGWVENDIARSILMRTLRADEFVSLFF